MKRTKSCALTLLLGFWLIVLQLPNVSYADSAAYVSTGLPQVVVVSGTNYDMGVQYGRQTAAAINHNLALMKSNLYDAYGETTVTNDMAVWDYYIKKYDPDLADWLKGIAKGCKDKKYAISYLDLVLLMVYPSEMWARPTTPYPKEAARTLKLKAARKAQMKPGYVPPGAGVDKTKAHSCNSFAATGSATRDGKPIIAIDQMVDEAAMDTVILIAFPKKGAAFISQPYAGRVNGNSAMNGSKFAWTMTAIMMDQPVWGLITETYFHYLAQDVTSTAAAQAYLKNTPRAGVTGGFTMSDDITISVFECNALAYKIRKPGDEGETGQFTVQTNHLVDPSLQQYNPAWLSFMGTYTRYDTVLEFITEALTPTASVDFSFTKNMFASDDWYDATGKTWHHNDPGSGNISNSHGTINLSIFSPADLIAYLATGTPSGNGMPAGATGEYVKIQLAKSPKAVTAQAGNYADAFYWSAVDLFEYELNAKPAYLTYEVAESIRAKLDEAFLAYENGMDSAAFANLEKNTQNQLALFGEALTYYAKAQLYSQLVTTQINKLKSGVTP